MNSKNLQNNLNEQENLSADEQKICDLVGCLENVCAPGDFEFRVKARISSASENNSRSWFRRTLRYTMPLTATAIVAAFITIQTGMFSQDQTPTGNLIAAENQNVSQNINNNVSTGNSLIAQVSNINPAANEPILVAANTQIQPEEIPSVKKPKPLNVKLEPKPNEKDNSGNSRIFAQRPSDINILPKGISLNPSTVNPNPGQNNSVSARAFLEISGLELQSDGNNLKVRSVKENSVGARSGIKSGDIIEAVDGRNPNQKISSETVKQITILRDGKTQTIEFKP